MKKGMKDMKKMVIAEIQAAKEVLLDILSGKQNADGQKIDAHITAAAKALDEARIKLEQERDALKTELASLKGIFAGIRRRDIETRLEQIETGLESYKED